MTVASFVTIINIYSKSPKKEIYHESYTSPVIIFYHHLYAYSL